MEAAASPNTQAAQSEAEYVKRFEQAIHEGREDVIAGRIVIGAEAAMREIKRRRSKKPERNSR